MCVFSKIIIFFSIIYKFSAENFGIICKLTKLLFFSCKDFSLQTFSISSTFKIFKIFSKNYEVRKQGGLIMITFT